MRGGFVPFAEVKRAVSLEAVLLRYGLIENLTRKGSNLAGACPFCEGRSASQFQVNLLKNAWYCFACKQGGNILDFVAKKEGMSVRAAALALDSWFELGLVEDAPPAKPPAAPALPQPVAAELLPPANPPLTFTLKTLDPHHASLTGLGLAASTLERFGAGYCTKGLFKGRLAVPIHSGQGELVAYAGLALDHKESPQTLFPPKFYPALEVMNLHRLGELAGEEGPFCLAPTLQDFLRLAETGAACLLGLFDGSLSVEQEEAIGGAVRLSGQLTLVGEGFADRTIARLARYAAVTWIAELADSSRVPALAEECRA